MIRGRIENCPRKIYSYFAPKKLVKSFISRFQQRAQKPLETVTQFISALRDYLHMVG